MKHFKIYRSRKIYNPFPDQKKLKIKKGNKVVVIAGDNKGKISFISKVIKQQFVYLTDIFIEKIIKKDGKEESVKQFKKIHISNVMHYCTTTCKRSKVNTILKDDKKHIVYSISKLNVPNTFLTYSEKSEKRQKIEDLENQLDEKKENEKVIEENNSKEK